MNDTGPRWGLIRSSAKSIAFCRSTVKSLLFKKKFSEFWSQKFFFLLCQWWAVLTQECQNYQDRWHQKCQPGHNCLLSCYWMTIRQTDPRFNGLEKYKIDKTRCHQWSTQPDPQSRQLRTLLLLFFVLLDFEKWGRMDGRHVQKQLSLLAVTVSRPSGSSLVSMIVYHIDNYYKRTPKYGLIIHHFLNSNNRNI